MRLSVIVVVVCLSAGGLSAAEDVQAAVKEHTNIPPQELSPALHSLAKARDFQLIYVSEDVSDLRTSGAVGQLTSEEALRKLLRGTGLVFRYLDAKTVTIIPAYLPVTQTVDGASSAAGGSSTLRWTPALAPTAEDDDGTDSQSNNDTADEEISEIIVTGTHIRGIAPESSPVVAFDQEAIRATGAPSMSEFLRSIPQNFGGGTNEENRGDGSSGLGGSGINLRGFGQERSLILVNGHRIANSGTRGDSVDVSIIPIAAVERVEIVTAGASSIYGSDAVGGVANFILRDDFDGAETGLVVGTLTDGDGTTFNANQTIGKDWSTGNALLVYDYFTQDSLRSGDRDFTDPSIAPTELIPNIDRHSVFTAFDQEFASQTKLFGDAYYVTSETARQSVFNFMDAFMQEKTQSEAYGVTLGTRREFGSSWQGEILATYSKTVQESSVRFVENPEAPVPSGFGDGLSRTSRSIIVEGRANGNLLPLPGGTIKLAVGGQGRFERFERTTPPSESRDVSAAFVELFIPLIGARNARTGFERLEISASARYERFGKGIDSVDPQVGLVWELPSGLVLRGTWGTSFRAPGLHERLSTAVAELFPFFIVPNPSTANPQTLLLHGFSEDTDVETSSFWTAGFDFTPRFAPDLNISLTYFDIGLTDEIARAPFVADLGDPLVAPFVTLDPSMEQILDAISAGNSTQVEIEGILAGQGLTLDNIEAIYDFRITNLAERNNRGFDARINYARDTDYGYFGFDLNAVYLTEFSLRTSAGAPLRVLLDQPFQPLDFRARAGISWSHGGADGNLFVNYADSYTDDRFGESVEVEDYTTVNATFGYEVDDASSALNDIRFVFGIQNLFDTDPPAIESASNNFNGDQGYDSFNASARGRYISLSVRKQW